jgi:hypothetical protein
MSLGFDKNVDEIYQAIQVANSKGVLVFAAASNDRRLASNFPISFPASMDSGVFSINSHSSDDQNTWSKFNPHYLPNSTTSALLAKISMGLALWHRHLSIVQSQK